MWLLVIRFLIICGLYSLAGKTGSLRILITSRLLGFDSLSLVKLKQRIFLTTLIFLLKRLSAPAIVRSVSSAGILRKEVL
jgi:hypothetical protein